MHLIRIFAHLSCSEIEASEPWFESLFGRGPDARPMPGLSEWHQDRSAGLQPFENAVDAGRGTLTLIVDDLQAEHDRLTAAGLDPGDVEPATSTGGPLCQFAIRKGLKSRAC